MTPKQKAYVKELEEKNEKLKKVIDEIGAANLKMAEGRDNARTALTDLVAAAEKLLKPGRLTTEDLDGNKYRFFPINEVDTFAAAVERAKAITEGEGDGRNKSNARYA